MAQQLRDYETDDEQGAWECTDESGDPWQDSSEPDAPRAEGGEAGGMEAAPDPVFGEPEEWEYDPEAGYETDQGEDSGEEE